MKRVQSERKEGDTTDVSQRQYGEVGAHHRIKNGWGSHRQNGEVRRAHRERMEKLGGLTERENGEARRAHRERMEKLGGLTE